MTASEDVRRAAREFLPFIVMAPIPGVFAFGFDGIYVGATWAREMRNLMLASLAIFLGMWWALQSFGNAGLWCSLIAFYVAHCAAEPGPMPPHSGSRLALRASGTRELDF